VFSCSGYSPTRKRNVNVSEFCDPDLDNLAQQARALDSTDPAGANLLWQQLDHRLTDASPDIFTVTGKAAALVSPRLRNYTRTPLGYRSANGYAVDRMFIRELLRRERNEVTDERNGIAKHPIAAPGLWSRTSHDPCDQVTLTGATAFAAVLLLAVIAVTLADARASTHAVSITCAGD
jgi:hypothetical protein